MMGVMGTATERPERVDLPITGMKGASCAGRVERTLDRLEGVDASVLRLTGALEAASEHPIGRAIAAAAAQAGPLPAPERFAGREGLGVEGVVEGREVVVGRPSLLARRGAPLPEPLAAAREAAHRMRALGLRPVLLTGDNATTARAVATAVGIDEVVAEVLPAGKVDVVGRLQSGSRWSATASTTRPRWRRPTSASPSAPGPTSPSRRPT